MFMYSDRRWHRRWLWAALLFAISAHADVMQTKDADDSGCMAETAQPWNDGWSRPCEDSRVATGGSMLQVASKTQFQSPEANADSGHAQAAKDVLSGSGAAFASLTEIVHSHGVRTPIFLLVALFLSLVCVCMLLLASRGVADRENRLIGQEGRAANLKSGPGVLTASSLPPAYARSPAQSVQMLNSHIGASPGSVRALPSQQGLLTGGASKHLCPGLVVPHGNECILAVPVMPSMAGLPSRDVATLNVQDLEGKPVIQADVVMPHTARASDPQCAIVVLRAGSAPRVGNQLAAPLLAYCKASDVLGSRKTVYIYDGRDEVFGQVSKENNRYVLSRSTDGVQLFLEGDIRHHAVTVTNEQSLVVSESSATVMSFNPGGSYYKLRVAANIDVGLILCALFSMDFLERS